MPAFVALAGGAMLLAPAQAQAEGLSVAKTPNDGSGKVDLCLDPSALACSSGADVNPAQADVPDEQWAVVARLSPLNGGLAPQFAIVGDTFFYDDGDSFAGNVNLASPATIRLAVATGTATQVGVFSGQASIEKIGAGTLNLVGNNSYIGTTTISAGTLQIGNGGTSGTLGSGAVFNNASLAFNRSDDITVGNTISGSGNLTKLGIGTVILTGNNAYAGTTTISAGILQIGNGGTSGTLGSGAVVNNARLAVNRSDDFVFANAMSGTGILNKSGVGTMTATAALTHTGDTNLMGGTLVIASTGSLSGPGNLTIAGGNLTLNNAVSSVRQASQNSGNLTLASGSRLDVTLNSYNLLGGSILGSGTIRIVNDNRTFSIGSASATVSPDITIEGTNPAGATVNIGVSGSVYTLGSTITGTAMRLAVSNPGGVTIISGNNSFGGGTTLNSGTLSVERDNALGSGALTMAGSTILTPGSSSFDGNRTLGNAIVLNGSPISFDVLNSAAVMRLSGVISGEPGFRKIGAGTLILSGANTYFGETTVQAGTLSVNSAGALGSTAGATTVNTGATLAFGASVALAENISFSGTGAGGVGALNALASVNLNGNMTLTGDGLVSVQDARFIRFLGSSFNATGGAALTVNTIGSSAVDLNSALSGIGSLVKDGTGQLELNGTNSFTGPITINAGVLQVVGGLAIPDSVSVTSVGTGTLALGSSETIGSLAGTGRVSLFNDSILTTGGNNTSTVYAGQILRTSGGLTKVGTGTFTLTGTNFYTGTTTISAGTLQIGDGGTTGTLGSGNVVNNAALVFNRSNDFTVANAISGSGTLTKQGAGQLTLTGANSYSGLTTIATGDLLVGAFGTTGALGTGNVVNNGRLIFRRSDDITVGNVISGTGIVAQQGSGTLTLTGNNTFAGGVGIVGGTLRIAADANLGLGTSLSILGGTLSTSASFTIARSIGLGAVGINGSFAPDTGTALTLTGAISGLGGLTKTGGGTLLIAANPSTSYSVGTFVNEGALFVSGIGALGTGGITLAGGTRLGAFGNATLANQVVMTGAASFESNVGAALTLTGPITGGQAATFNGTVVLAGDNSFSTATISTGSTLTIGSGGTTGTLGSGNVVNNGALVFNRSNAVTVSNAISGTGSLTKLGDGILTLTGANSLAGITTISGGTLQIGAGGTTGAFGSGNIVNNAALVFNRSDDIAAANLISGTGSLTKQGAGNLTLSGANAYSGVTFVNAGTLTVANSAALGTAAGNTIVADGAGLVLQGGSFVSDAITINGNGVAGGGALRAAGPGTSGTLGQITLGSASRIAAQGGNLNINGGIVGTNVDLTFNAEGIVGVLSQISLGSGRLIKEGNGQLAMLLGDAQVGELVISGGQVQLNSGGGPANVALADTAHVQINNGSITLANSETIGSLSGSALANIGDVAAGVILTVGVNNASTLYAGRFSSGSTLGLTKVGTGTLTLTGDSFHTGITTISGGTLQIGNGGTSGNLGLGNVVNNAALVLNRSNDATFANAMSGTGTLRKLGSGVMALTGNLSLGSVLVEAGTLALSGSNSFIGGITVAGGTLSLRSSNAAGGASGLIRTTGSVIDFANGVSIATPIQLNSNTTQLQVLTGTAIQSGVISEIGGARPLEKIGGGTLVLTGTNAYSGGTTIAAGRLQVAANANLGAATGGITIGNGVLATSASFTSARAVSLTGTAGIDVAAGTILTLSNGISGAGSLAKTGDGQLLLTSNSTYFGTTTISGSGGLTVGSGGTTGSLGAGNVAITSGSFLAYNRSDAFSVANAISGLGALSKQGGGTMTLTGANTFSGGLTLSGGTVVLGSASAGVINAAGTGSIQMSAGTSLRSAVSGTLSNALSLNGVNITLAAASGTTLRLAGATTLGGPIGSTLNVGTGAATGTIELAPTAMTLGEAAPGIAVNGGTLRLANDNAFAFVNAGSGITLNGATLGADVAGTLTRQLTIGSAGGTIDVTAPSLTSQAGITMLGGLTKTGAGDLRLTASALGNQTISVNAGTLSLVGNGVVAGSGTLRLATGTTLRFDTPIGNTYINPIVLGAGTGSTIVARNATLTGALSGGTLNVDTIDGTGFLVLSGNNSYGATNLATGVRLQVGLGGTSGTLGTGAVTLGAGSFLLFSRSDDMTVSNVISGSGAIQKALGNTLNLTGSNTAAERFTGSASAQGTLLINGTFGDVVSRLANVSIGSGGTLGGSGTIAGNVVVFGGTLSPGNSVGTLTIAGNLTLNNTSALNFELGAAGVVGGGANDLVNVGGNLVLDGILNIAALPGFGAGYYRLFNYGGTLTNNVLTTGTLPAGFTASIRTDIAGQVNVLLNAGAQQVQYWDGTDLTGASATINGEGGAGTWTSASTNWTSPTGFAVNSAWAGQLGIFAGAAGGTVSVTGSQAFQELRFQTDGYRLTAAAPSSGLSTTGGFSIINVGTLRHKVQIDAPISGAGGLTKTGFGELILRGTNTYTGLTTVSSGVLSLLDKGTIAGSVLNNAVLIVDGTVAGLVTNTSGMLLIGTVAGGINNSASGTASIGGTFNGTISNSGSITLVGATTGTGAFVQTAGASFNLGGNSASIGSLGGAGTVSLGNATLTIGSVAPPPGSPSTDTTFAGVITGTGGLTKTGTGTLTLSGTNTYTGTTNITAGTLAVQGGAAIADNAAVRVGAGGMFQLLDSERIGGLTGAGRVLLGANQLTIAGAAPDSYDGVISGSGGLIVTGASTLSLNGANTYTGLTTVSGLFTSLGVGSAGSLSGYVAISDRGRFTNQGTVNGSVTVELGSELSSTGTIRGNVTGPRMDLAGLVTGSVTAGSVNAGTALTINGALTLTGGGIFGLNNSTVSIGSLAGSGTTSLIADSSLTVGTDNTSTTYTGTIQGLGPFTKVGNGVLSISGTIDLRRGMVVSGGTLEIASGSLVREAISSPATITNNAILINAGTVSGLVSNSGSLTSAASGLGGLLGGLTNNAGATASIRGTLSGPVVNSGTITVTGLTTGTSAFTQTADGVLDLADGNATIGSLAGAGTIRLSRGRLTVGEGGGSGSFGGVISGPGGMTKVGTGTLTLTGASTGTGSTVVLAGTLAVSAGASILGRVTNNATMINAGFIGDEVSNTASFTNSGQVNGVFTNSGALVNTGLLRSGLVNRERGTAFLSNTLIYSLNNSGLVTFIGAGSGAEFFAQSASGTTNLNGFNATFGRLDGAGLLQLGGATMSLGGTNADSTYEGIIAGAGTLDKLGTGTLTLSGTNTVAANFTGAVNLNAGALIVNGSFGDVVANTATLNVASGATLGGSGTFRGNVNVAAGGSIFPGTSPGTLAIAGDLTLSAGAILNFELAQAGVIGGGINDLITVGGNLTLAGTANLFALPGFGEGIYRLINYGGTLTDNGLALGLRPDGYIASLITSVAGQVSVQFSTFAPSVLYWDGTDLTGSSPAARGNGGGGVWNSTSANWTFEPTFATNVAWGGQTGVFAGAAGGTVEVAGAQAFQQLRFETGGYTLTAAGAGGSLATTGGISIIDVAAGLAATVNVPVSGTAGLTKAGAGVLNLGGVNTYSGLTSIAEGTLALAAGGRIAGAVENNATFINAGTVDGVVSNRGTLTSSGIIFGGLTNNGTANLLGRVDAVTNTGTITVSRRVRVNGTFDQTASGVFDLADGAGALGNLTGAGQIRVGTGLLIIGVGSSAGEGSFGGVISGSGTIDKNGAGTLVLTGANTFTGLTSISGGVLNIAAGASLGGVIQNSDTFINAGTVTGRVSAFTASVTNNTGTITGAVSNGGTLTSTGIILGGLSNDGQATLSGRIDGGITNTATITLAGTLRAVGAFTQTDRGVFDLAGRGAVLGSLAGGGEVRIGSGVLSVGSNGTSTTFAGVISGTGAFNKNGSGTLTLTGVNTFNGVTAINFGGLAIASGARLDGEIQNSDIFTNAGTVGGLVRSFSGSVTTNTGTITGAVINGAALTSTGIILGGLTNNGTATLSGRIDGGIANAGTITLSGTLRAVGAFTQTAGGVFDLAGRGAVLGSLAGDGQVRIGSGNLTIGSGTGTGAGSFAGVLSGTGAFNKNGSGTLILTGLNTFTGVTAINSGGLTIAAGASLGGEIQNADTLTNAGTFNGLVRTFTGSTTTNSGTITGGAINGGSLVSTGTILAGLTNSGTATLAGRIDGGIANTGTITLSGTLRATGAFTQTTRGVFDLAGRGAVIGSLAGDGQVRIGAGTLTLGGNNSSTTFAGVISGSGFLTKTGTGTLTLTGVNTFSGLTTIDGGTLVIGDGASPGAAPATAIIPAVGAEPPLAVTRLAAAPDAAAPMLGTPGVTQLASAIGSAVIGTDEPLGRPAGGMSFGLANGMGSAVIEPASAMGAIGGGLQPERDNGMASMVLGVDRAMPVTPVDGAATAMIGSFGTASGIAGGAQPGLANAMATISIEDGAPGGTAATAPTDAALASAMVPDAGPVATAAAAAPSTAVLAGNVLNNANLINNGTILGRVINAAGATGVNNGTIAGTVNNAGTFTSVGTLSGGLVNSGSARIRGVLVGEVFNAGSITLTGVTSGITLLEQTPSGRFDLGGFDTTIGVISGGGTITLGSARLTTGTNGVNSLFEGVISGSGSLFKTGSGGLILTGENLFTGGTTIAAGTLQLGNGGTTGSLVGPVVNNGALIVNRSNAYTLSSAISGTGVFVHAGSGTTTLTGANTYSGGTLIAGGRLIGSTTSLQGLIQNDAALEFAQATNGVFAGRIGGSGIFDKTGAGLLELTGDNSALRGVTTVRAGELRVTGSLAGSATTVLAGATLSGTGTVGGLVARSGAIVSPGANGLGTLGVNGAIQLQSGSTLRLQVQAVSGSDMLIGNGALQVGGTAAISNLGGTFAFNSNYLLLQASGGRTGTFEAVTGLSDFGILYRPELVYTNTQVLLRMAPNLLANIVGNAPLTANQRSVASRIDAAMTAGYNPQPLFAIYTLAAAQQVGALDQLSGEAYATATAAGVEQERLVREAVLGRVAAVAAAARRSPEAGQGPAAWGQVLRTWGEGQGDGNAARFDIDREGFITGIDYGKADDERSWRAGAYGFHLTNMVNVAARGSRMQLNQTGGGVYAGASFGGFSFGLGGTLAGVDLTATRQIALPGFVESNRGFADGRSIQTFAEVSYTLAAGKATFRPFLSAAAGWFKLDALTESGGASALSVQRQRFDSTSITAGTDAAVQIGKVQLSGTLAGRMQIGDRSPTALIALAAAPAQGFAVNGVQLDRLALAARFDATVALSRHADLSLGYTGLIGADTADHGARATISVRF